MRNKIILLMTVVISIVFSQVVLFKFDPNLYTYNNYDSDSYFDFTLYPTFRMQIITLIYSLIQENIKIVIFQFVVYILSSVILAYSFFYYFTLNRIKILAFITILVFASSSVLLQNNYKITSESLNTSAQFLFTAATLNYARLQTKNRLVLLACAMYFLAGTKAVSAVSLLLISLVIFIFDYMKNCKENHLKLYTLLIIPILFFTFSANSSNISHVYTTSSIINERLWKNNDWKEKVIEARFPLEARKVWENYRSANLGLPPDQAVVNNKLYENWYKTGGENFLYKFMLSNLNYTLIGPFCLPCLNSNFSFRETVLSGWSQGTDEIRSEGNEMKNEFLFRTVFWPDEPEYAYLIISLVFLLLSIYMFIKNSNYFKRDLNSNFFLGISCIYLLSYSLLSWYLGSKSNDMFRHQLGAAVMIRINIIFLFFFILNNLSYIISRKAKIIN